MAELPWLGEFPSLLMPYVDMLPTAVVSSSGVARLLLPFITGSVCFFHRDINAIIYAVLLAVFLSVHCACADMQCWHTLATTRTCRGVGLCCCSRHPGPRLASTLRRGPSLKCMPTSEAGVPVCASVCSSVISLGSVLPCNQLCSKADFLL